jgi:hypothetical protein
MALKRTSFRIESYSGHHLASTTNRVSLSELRTLDVCQAVLPLARKRRGSRQHARLGVLALRTFLGLAKNSPGLLGLPRNPHR